MTASPARLLCSERQRIAVAIGKIRIPARDLALVAVREIDVGAGGEHPHPLADELIALRVVLGARRELRRARARLGDAVGGHRVIDEHRRDVGGRQTLVAAHGLEEAAHGVGVEAGAGEVADADAIGLHLIVAREIDLLLHREALGGRDAALQRLAAADGAEQDGREDGGGGGQALLALRADLARDVVLRDVRDFVRHDARQLRLGGGREHQALVQEDEAAGHGEGVDRRGP